MGRHRNPRDVVADDPAPSAESPVGGLPRPRGAGTHSVARAEADTAVIDLRLVHARRRANQVALAGDIAPRAASATDIPPQRHRHRSSTRRTRTAPGRHCR